MLHILICLQKPQIQCRCYKVSKKTKLGLGVGVMLSDLGKQMKLGSRRM